MIGACPRLARRLCVISHVGEFRQELEKKKRTYDLSPSIPLHSLDYKARMEAVGPVMAGGACVSGGANTVHVRNK